MSISDKKKHVFSMKTHIKMAFLYEKNRQMPLGRQFRGFLTLQMCVFGFF
jgi:hypothetical protein